MDEVAYTDIEGLNARAGEFGPWGPERQVTQEMINRFADLTGDHQWIHVDVERAKAESPFGGPVAHGFLSLSLLPSLAGSAELRLTGFANVANYGAEKLRFMAPVPAGAMVHARTRLVRAEAKARGTLVTSEVELAVVGAQRPSLVYMMQALYMGA